MDKYKLIRKLIGWAICAFPSGYWIGIKLNYTLSALMIAMLLMSLSLFLILWDDLK